MTTTPGPQPDPAHLTEDQILDMIANSNDAIKAADRRTHLWVQVARTRNISFARIGKRLGVSRQAAWERFSKGKK